MKKLENVSLICIDCHSKGAAILAMQKSIEQIQFERVLFLTDTQLNINGIEVIQIPTINSKREYSEFCIKKLAYYITTDYFMIIQADGYVINGHIWDDRYLDYDYIGASWIFDSDRQVGNGGASLRSKKLHDILAADESIDVLHPEDHSICIVYKFYLEEKYGIKFAPVELADKFSYECKEPNQPTFAFHGNFHPPYSPTVILKRSGACGDIIILEPVLRYYAMKGYNVVLDIPLPFFELYANHYFPVKHISQFDAGRISPEKNINLDLAYEVKPQQNYLKSYFEFCGIPDYQLSRPQLYPLVDGNTKLFKKYACVHIDNRATLHRNTYGVNWKAVERYLTNNGYTVIQIGKNEHESCGIEINTQAVGFMKYVISGCDLFVGVDSAPAGIAMAYNKPCVLLFGSVNPDYIHPDLSNAIVVQGACDNSFCWHNRIGSTEGVECKYINTNKYLQCCASDADIIIDAIEQLVKK